MYISNNYAVNESFQNTNTGIIITGIENKKIIHR